MNWIKSTFKTHWVCPVLVFGSFNVPIEYLMAYTLMLNVVYYKPYLQSYVQLFVNLKV